MMKTFLTAALAAALFATAAAAESPFDGNWKGDPAAAKMPTKPDVILVAHGIYQCKTCTPPISVPADGRFHAVTGHDYYDEVAVKVADPHTVVVENRKAGKMMGKMTATVSADGKTLTRSVEDMSATNGAAVSGKSTEMRVAAGPAGSHAVSGSWRQDKGGEMSDAALTFTIKTQGDMIRVTDGMGDDVEAKIGGGYALTKGDPGKTMAKFAKLGPRMMRETDMRGGKVVSINTYTVSADGKTMTNAWQDVRRGTTGTFVAHRQP